MKRVTKGICPNLMIFCSDIFFLKLTYINMSYCNEGMQNYCLVCDNLCCLYLCLEDFASIEFVEIFSANRGVRWFKSTDSSETDFISVTRFLMFETEPISETVFNLNNLIWLSVRKGFTEISECLTYIYIFSPLLFSHEDGGSVFTRKLGTNLPHTRVCGYFQIL